METIKVDPPDPPAWIADSPAGRWAWESDLNWRVNASQATNEVYRTALLNSAGESYAAHLAGRGRGRPAKAEAESRKHTGVYMTAAERAAVEAVLHPGESFSEAMCVAARLLVAARSA